MPDRAGRPSGTIDRHEGQTIMTPHTAHLLTTTGLSDTHAFRLRTAQDGTTVVTCRTCGASARISYPGLLADIDVWEQAHICSWRTS
jgi:hypothetical protein